MRNMSCLLLYFCLYTSLILVQTTSTNPHSGTFISDKEPVVWCKFQPNGYDCNEIGIFVSHYYYDTKLEDCKIFNFGVCRNVRNKFKTLNDCRDNCLDPGGRDIFGNVSANVYCKFQPDFGLCNEYHPMFYFDVTTRICKGFSYSGCGGNSNRFSTSQSCNTVCGPYIEHEMEET